MRILICEQPRPAEKLLQQKETRHLSLEVCCKADGDYVPKIKITNVGLGFNGAGLFTVGIKVGATQYDH